MEKDANTNTKPKIPKPEIKMLWEVITDIKNIAHNNSQKKTGYASFLNTKYSYFSWKDVQNILHIMRQNGITLSDSYQTQKYIHDESECENIDKNGVVKKVKEKKISFELLTTIKIESPVKVDDKIIYGYVLSTQTTPISLEFKVEFNSSQIIPQWSKSFEGAKTFTLRSDYLRVLGLYEETESGTLELNNQEKDVPKSGIVNKNPNLNSEKNIENEREEEKDKSGKTEDYTDLAGLL